MKRQQEIAGTERPEQDPDIENALYAWFDAKEEQKRTGETTKIRHASLLVLVEASGREHYPYLDPKTGKKMRVRIQKTPKVATERDVWRRKDADAEIGDEVTPPNSDDPPIDNVVEMRRVKRSTVEKEIDPFASTRAALDDDSAAAELDAIGGTYAEKMAAAFGGSEETPAEPEAKPVKKKRGKSKS